MAKKTGIIWLIFLLLMPASVRAEDLNEARQVVRRETAAQKRAVAAAQASEKKDALKSGEISFADVLRRPDDVALNFRYAQQQVKKNDLLGAAGALERILIVHPELHEVRLFYAVVLFRLDNLTETEAELAKLQKVELPGNLKNEVAIYQKAIKKRKKKTQFALTQSNGFGWDSNRNSAPSSKRVLFTDFPINTVRGSTGRRHDTHFLNITSVEAAHDLGFQAGHQVFGNFTYFQQEQTQVDNLDLGSFQYDFGTVLKNRFADFTPSYSASHIFLSRENYQRTKAGNFELNRSMTPKLNLTSAFRMEHQDYLPIEEIQSARVRDGWEVSFTNGAAYALPKDMRIGGGIVYARKNARQDYEDYNRLILRFFHSWLLGKGQFLLNSIDNGFDYYQIPDTAIASQVRKDTTLRYRITYGAPLTTLLIGKILPGPLKDITATVSYEYYRSLSTITNYTYTNYKVQTLFTKRVEF